MICYQVASTAKRLFHALTTIYLDHMVLVSAAIWTMIFYCFSHEPKIINYAENIHYTNSSSFLSSFLHNSWSRVMLKIIIFCFALFVTISFWGDSLDIFWFKLLLYFSSGHTYELHSHWEIFGNFPFTSNIPRDEDFFVVVLATFLAWVNWQMCV